MKLHHILPALILISSTVHGQWTPLNSGTLLNLSVIQQNHTGSLFVAGYGEQFVPVPGIIMKSDDGGATWNTVASNYRGFTDIVFLNGGVGLAIPKSTDTIFRSVDGGNTWVQQYSLNCYPQYRGFPDVYFTDSLTGYGPGYKTTDGGASWFLQFQPVTTFPFVPLAIHFINDSTGMIAGYEYWGAIYKTTDRGVTWSTVIVPYNTWEIYSLNFPTPYTGYCTSYKYSTIREAEIIKTIDGGDHWSSIYTTSLLSLFTSIFCTDSSTCYAVGLHGNIAKTTDGGVTWNSQTSGTTQTLRKVFFTDANTGYIVGDSGTILKTINGGEPIGISETTGNNTVSVFPNPSSAAIQIQTAWNGFSYSIIDLAGRILLSGKSFSRNYNVSLDEVVDGTYFLSLQHNDERVVERLVKVLASK